MRPLSPRSRIMAISTDSIDLSEGMSKVTVAVSVSVITNHKNEMFSFWNTSQTAPVVQVASKWDFAKCLNFYFKISALPLPEHPHLELAGISEEAHQKLFVRLQLYTFTQIINGQNTCNIFLHQYGLHNNCVNCTVNVQIENTYIEFLKDFTFKSPFAYEFIRISTRFKIFKKELHLPSPFTKTGNLFWPDFTEVRFFVYQEGPNQKNWSK